MRLPSRLGQRPLVWAVLVLGVVAIVAWRASAWNAPATTSLNAGGATSGYDDSPGLTLYPADDRPSVPDVEGNTLDGDRLALSDLAGNVVVLNVWGSWCGPCRAEAPDLARLANETANQAVRFVGIDTRDTTAAAQAFVRSFDIPYPSIVDVEGKLLLEFDGLVSLTAVPSTLVIDPQGNVAAKVIGQITYETLRGVIKDELATAGNTAPQDGS